MAKFAPGNPGGPGRPPRAVETTYLRIVSESCPPDKWRAICENAGRDALAGDAKARDFLARHLIGNPEREALFEAQAWEESGRDRVSERAESLKRCAATNAQYDTLLSDLMAT